MVCGHAESDPFARILLWSGTKEQCASTEKTSLQSFLFFVFSTKWFLFAWDNQRGVLNKLWGIFLDQQIQFVVKDDTQRSLKQFEHHFSEVIPANTHITRVGGNTGKKGHVLVVKPVSKAYVLTGHLLFLGRKWMSFKMTVDPVGFLKFFHKKRNKT